MLKTVAPEGEGVDDVLERIDAHHAHLEDSGELARRRREHLVKQARAVLLRRMERRGEELWTREAGPFVEELVEGRLTPYRVADAVEARLEGPGG